VVLYRLPLKGEIMARQQVDNSQDVLDSRDILNASWPNNCIDWDEATDLLKQDYFSVDFDGVDYLIRS